MANGFNQKVLVLAEVPLFELFPGKPVEQMPILLGSKPSRNPITLYRILDLRVNNNPDQEEFRNNYFTSADQFIRDQNSHETKVVYYEHPVAKELAAKLKSTKQLVNWSLPTTDDLYQGLEGDMVHVIPASVVKDLLNNPYSHAKEREAFWEFAVRGNTQVYKDNMKLQKERGRTIDNCMGIFPSQHPGMRLVWVGSVGGNYSLAGGINDLDNDDGRLVGELAPEVLTELSESSQKTKEITPSQKQLITPVWQYISTTPATELTKKGLQKVIDNHYKSK